MVPDFEDFLEEIFGGQLNAKMGFSLMCFIEKKIPQNIPHLKKLILLLLPNFFLVTQVKRFIRHYKKLNQAKSPHS